MRLWCRLPSYLWMVQGAEFRFLWVPLLLVVQVWEGQVPPGTQMETLRIKRPCGMS